MKWAETGTSVTVIVLLTASAAYTAELPFANYGMMTMIDQPGLGQIEWSGNYYDGTWNWLPNEAPPLPGWDLNVTQHVNMQFTSELSVDENLMATGSFVVLTTIISKEDGEVSGTLVLSETAENGLLDLNAAHAIVDDKTGMIFLRSGSALDEGRPITEVTLVDATGRFAGVEQIGPWKGYYSGYYIKPIWAEMDLQQNIFEAPFIGGLFEVAVTGLYSIAESMGPLRGDFDGNGHLGAEDIDLLSQASLDNAAFDLTGDGRVDEADRIFWVRDLAGTFFGDADLDKSVGFADFTLLANDFGAPGGWMNGDFDGDGAVRFSDFLILANNFGEPTMAPASVPEPSTLLLLLCGMIVSRGMRR